MEFLGRIGRAAVSAGLLDTMTSSISNRIPTDNTSVWEISGRAMAEELFDFEPSYRYYDHVARFPVLLREGGMILHGPTDSGLLDRQLAYNIILHQSNSSRMFNLFRTDDLQEAQNVFGLYNQTIPVLAQLDTTIFDKTLLDKIGKKLREPASLGWTALHVCAAFDLCKHMEEPSLKKLINSQCTSDLKTPLHIAIIYQSLSAVSKLLSLGATMELKDLKGNTVIHFGAESSASILTALFEKLPEKMEPLINELNLLGLTPLHTACKANKPETVKALLAAGADVNISTPYDGYPIHIAVKLRSICSIQELVARAPDQLNLKDSKEGGTPLHWAGGPEILILLLDLGCDPNIVNNVEESPLHIAARRGCLKSTIYLLCHSAFPDMKDNKGNTPLHVASRLCSKSIMQALIIFGADCDLVNEEGESARHLVCTSERSDKDQIMFYLSAVGAKRCPESLKNRCTRGCLYVDSTQFEGIPPENYPTAVIPNLMHDALSAASVQKEIGDKTQDLQVEMVEDMQVDGPVQTTVRRGSSPQGFMESQIGGRLLCLDGGGIRGLVLTQILHFMEQECGVRIIDLFDWVAGTSTGGILALGLASGKTVAEIQGLYLRLKDRVFIGERPYRSETMDEFLKQEFGEETKMSNIRRPRVMITTALVDRRPVEFHFFRNYLSPHSLLGEREPCCSHPEEELVWECAKRTGAAPSFFRLDGKFIDGGLVSNNPTLDALSELTHFMVTLKALGDLREKRFSVPSVVVSLGTGIQPSTLSNASNLDIAWPSGILDAFTKVPRIATLVNLLVDQATQAEGQVVERARAWCSSIGVPFFRFSPRMSTYVDLDEKNDETLVNLMWETRAYMFAHKEVVVELKHILFQNGSPPPQLD